MILQKISEITIKRNEVIDWLETNRNNGFF